MRYFSVNERRPLSFEGDCVGVYLEKPVSRFETAWVILMVSSKDYLEAIHEFCL